MTVLFNLAMTIMLVIVIFSELDLLHLQQTSLSVAENESSVIVRLKQLESLRQRLMLILQRLRDLMLTLQSGLR